MNSTQLVQIRKDFYLNIRKRVESVLGKESTELRRYKMAYDKEVNSVDGVPVDKKKFFDQLKSSNIILIGDFHAQKQSSRSFLRVIRSIKNPIVIALECLRFEDQKSIDLYLSGKISERDFLSQIQWKKNWGFPWENYKPIFRFAQQKKIKIYGINSSNKKLTLSARDAFSAKKIKEILKQNSNCQLYVQYGDWHLASQHLPKSIKKNMTKANVCTVFQSPEVLYFKAMEKSKDHQDVIRIDSSRWALNSISPWVKWQDYLLYLESGFDKRMTNVDVDPSDTIAQSVEFYNRTLGLNVSISDLAIYSSSDDVFFDKIETLSVAIRSKIIDDVQLGRSFFVPELACGYLARYSVNHVVKLSAEYMYWKVKGYNKLLLDPRKDFLRFVWLETVVYFFSKIKNPKRKTDTLADIRQALEKELFEDKGKEALSLALNQKLTEMRFLAEGRLRNINFATGKYSKKSYQTAAEIIGGIMGEKLFYALNKKLIKLPLNQTLVFKNLNHANFNKIYYESMEMLESWPVFFKSKYDKL